MTNSFIDRSVLKIATQTATVFRSRYGLVLVGMISFAESALPVPLITDPFLVAYLLVNQTRLWLGVVVTTLSSTLGGLSAYLMAAALYSWLLSFLSPEHIAELNAIIERFQDGTFVITLLGAISPVPYTLVALGAGFVQGSLLAFIAATVLGRGVRYAVVGYATHRYGQRALQEAKRNIRLATICSVVLVLLFLAYKLH